eukprot:175289_1
MFQQANQANEFDIFLGELENLGPRYSLRRSLRDTLFGKVYLALDNQTGQAVIAKQCGLWNVREQTSITGHAVREDVFNEIRLHRELSLYEDCSQFILKLLNVVRDKHSIYIILEFACGGELFSFLKTRGDSASSQNGTSDEKAENGEDASMKPKVHPHERQAQKFMRQLMAAVSYMHSKYICHRDLSLENLLLDGNMNLKTIDFGLAIGGSDSAFSQGRWRVRGQGRVGKIAYMAPEVFSNREYDARMADIWSCGVIFFILMVGCPPYEIPVAEDKRFTFIINNEVRRLLRHWQLLDQFSDSAIDLLQRMLLVEPNRIRMDEILNHPFIRED